MEHRIPPPRRAGSKQVFGNIKSLLSRDFNRFDSHLHIFALTKMATDCIAGCCCESFIMMGITNTIKATLNKNGQKPNQFMDV
jgi:hypothetical protein